MSMRDSKKFSLLTYAAYRNQSNCFKIIFEYAWQHNFLSQDDLKNSQINKFQSWVNEQTEDQFTALHFATRHANFTILTLLIEKAGADLYIKNKFGATIMHIAA